MADELAISSLTRTSPTKLAIWEQWCVSIVVVIAVFFSVLPEGITLKESYDGASEIEGSSEVRLIWGSVYVLSGIIVYRHRALTLLMMRAINPFLIMLLIYTGIGLIWTPEFVVTMKRVIQFAGFLLFTVVVQIDDRRWPYFAKLIFFTLLALELGSAAVALAMPSVGIDAYFGYAWRGLFTSKNSLGGTAATGLLFLMGLWRNGNLTPPIKWAGSFLSVLCVVLSTSSTAFTIMSLGIMVFWLFQTQHVRSRLWLLRVIVVTGMIVLFLAFIFFIGEGRFPSRQEMLEPFANLFGKSADLTGRTDIWEPVINEIGNHLLFGIGYGAFWLGPGSASQVVIDTLPWIPYQAHNGYLDITNELGLIGFTLFLGMIIVTARDLTLMTQFDRPGAALFGSILVTLLVANYTESSIFRGLTFEYWLLLLACVSASTAVWRHRN
jgi:O-antigen ligase